MSNLPPTPCLCIHTPIPSFSILLSLLSEIVGKHPNAPYFVMTRTTVLYRLCVFIPRTGEGTDLYRPTIGRQTFRAEDPVQ